MLQTVLCVKMTLEIEILKPACTYQQPFPQKGDPKGDQRISKEIPFSSILMFDVTIK